MQDRGILCSASLCIMQAYVVSLPTKASSGQSAVELGTQQRIQDILNVAESVRKFEQVHSLQGRYQLMPVRP